MTITAAADGSALGNPGPAGWAWYIDEDRWASGGWPHGTNNMGELTAVLDLLQQTAHLDDELLIYCDSRYVIDSITRWMPGWKRNGWRKKDGKPVLNVELMKALEASKTGRRLHFEWVKGHAGHPLNEAADRLANAAAVAWGAGTPPPPGPGIPGAPRTPAPAVGMPVTANGVEAEPDLFSAGPPLASSSTDADHGSHPATPPAALSDEIVALERLLLSDEVRGDPDRVAALLHQDWQEIDAVGRRWTRADLLAGIASLPSTTLEVLAVSQISADSVLLLSRRVSNASATLRSSLWVHGGQRWQQRFHQGTPAT